MIGGTAVFEGGKKRWMKVMGQYRNCWIVPEDHTSTSSTLGVKGRVPDVVEQIKYIQIKFPQCRRRR